MVRIVLVGGCEKQARVVEALRPPADVALRAIHPAMNSRWNRQLRQVKNAARNADAIVMTTDVRTEFGRELKRWARKHDIPLVVRHGRGQRAIEALIVEARDRALRKRSGAGT